VASVTRDQIPAPAAGQTTRVSVSGSGSQANSGSYGSALSGDGRYVGFVSTATNLIPGDTNGRDDVFVRDNSTGVLTRINAGRGVQGNGIRMIPPSVSLNSDGRYAAFQTDDTNLVPGPANYCTVVSPGTQPCPSIFLRDMGSGGNQLISASNSGVPGNGVSEDPAISGDGRYVAFISLASNLVPGDTNQTADVFVRDVQKGTTRRVSVTSGGAQANRGSYSVSISANGRYVAFTSLASNLAAGTPVNSIGVFVHDMQTGTTRRVGVWGTRDQTELGDLSTSISGNGRYVAFLSNASNLVKGDTNHVADVFVRDMKTGSIRRASLTATGKQNGQYSRSPVISANGRYVLFSSIDMNLAPGVSGPSEIYIRDLVAGTTRVVSVSNTGANGDVDSYAPAITSDGRYAAFADTAGNLVTGDSNQQSDVFLRGPLY
jgi:Tol biopolymer transport system component